MLEAELQATVTEAMGLMGFMRAHFRPALTKHGWRTAGSYEAKGWPDVFAAHPTGRCFAWEFKSESGDVAPEQQLWIDVLAAVPGVDARVIRPADLDWALGQVMAR